MYYNPEYGKCVSDELYDKEEIKYKEACEDLGLEPTASNNVGFPWDTPSGRLVVSKFQIKLPKNVKTLPVITSNPHEVEETRTRIRKRTRSTEEPKRVRTRTRPKEDNVEEITKRVRTRPRKRSP
jgi:hypothetical protein